MLSIHWNIALTAVIISVSLQQVARSQVPSSSPPSRRAADQQNEEIAYYVGNPTVQITRSPKDHVEQQKKLNNTYLTPRQIDNSYSGVVVTSDGMIFFDSNVVDMARRRNEELIVVTSTVNKESGKLQEAHVIASEKYRNKTFGISLIQSDPAGCWYQTSKEDQSDRKKVNIVLANPAESGTPRKHSESTMTEWIGLFEGKVTNYMTGAEVLKRQEHITGSKTPIWLVQLDVFPGEKNITQWGGLPIFGTSQESWELLAITIPVRNARVKSAGQRLAISLDTVREVVAEARNATKKE